MEKIELRFVDDPANVRVYKGPGHYPATRAQIALRKVEQRFPQLSFTVASDRQLSSLRAFATLAEPIESVQFIDALSEALEETGTRMASLPV
jgi:hypothetical protein